MCECTELEKMLIVNNDRIVYVMKELDNISYIRSNGGLVNIHTEITLNSQLATLKHFRDELVKAISNVKGQ